MQCELNRILAGYGDQVSAYYTTGMDITFPSIKFYLVKHALAMEPDNDEIKMALSNILHD